MGPLIVSVGAALAVAGWLVATHWHEARNDLFVIRMWWGRKVREHRADKAAPDVGLSLLAVPAVQSHRLPRRTPPPHYRLCATTRDTTIRLAVLAHDEATRELAYLQQETSR